MLGKLIENSRTVPLLKSNEAPLQDYYARNVLAVIESVCAQYDDLLSDAERQFAYTTLSLSEPAIRLFARLVSRTRNLIWIDSLNYAEVSNLSAALEELQRGYLISINDEGEVTELLKLLTVPELRRLFAERKLPGRKPEIIEHVLELFDEATLRRQIVEQHDWLHVSVSEIFELFCLLFFGNSMQRLDEFVMRDLGVSRFEKYDLNRAYRLFPDREAIDRYLEFNALAELVERIGRDVSLDVATLILDELEELERDQVFELRRSGILNALGRNLERAGLLATALQCYACSTTHPARERTVRILKREGQDDQAENLRSEILNAPRCYAERQFAERFKRPAVLKTSIALRTSEVPSCSELRIENYAVQALLEEGSQAWHLENLLPMGLFGLSHWEWLYAPVRGAFVNPFQAAPLDLYSPEFFELRRAICTDPLAEPGDLKSKIIETAARKRGITTHLVAWSVFSSELLALILDAITTTQLCALLNIVVEDLRQYRAGFPDLSVIGPNGNISFVEVKGPGDQLRPNQRLWIERLSQAHFPVHVWRFK